MKTNIGFVVSGNQGPPFPGHVATSTGANFPPGPPSSIGGPHPGVPPPSTFPLPTSSVPTGMPPHYNQPAGSPHVGMPPPPGVQQGMPPQQVMPPPVSGMPPLSAAGTPPVPGPPTSMGAGIAGRRQYPQMVILCMCLCGKCDCLWKGIKVKLSNVRKTHPGCIQNFLKWYWGGEVGRDFVAI